ncbi:energy-coupling factor transporter transmembrane component T [Virgibacillus soli]|uniref:Energy-coupling factor transporter transmembrane component T n=1 Tax=Paracerasibacillus soli TaxID=480284 RepID=A0ABU5CV37_9BACI|nr:energy-coupling factor transporter transmembrane component T [Virgibacillus soli]MDY0410238.1 energy-coupling factor transporter transmembrane component T [Virgibacillus soli]
MESGFRGYHPYVQFLYYIYTGALAFYFNHPLFLCTAFLLIVFVNISHDRGLALKQWIPALFIMATIIIVLNPFLVSRGTNILFYFRGKQVTLEATIYGVTMALSIALILLIFVSFNLILNGNRFLYIFSKFLPRTAFLIMLAIRFVPLLKRRLQEITAVQRIRGISMVEGSIIKRAKTGMVFTQILLTWSLEEAIQTADSMKSRGYGIGRKSTYIPFQITKRDWGWLLTLSLLFIICISGGLLGYGKILIYPKLGTLHIYSLDWFLYICMIMLYSFPILVEGREQLRWR